MRLQTKKEFRNVSNRIVMLFDLRTALKEKPYYFTKSICFKLDYNPLKRGMPH